MTILFKQKTRMKIIAAVFVLLASAIYSGDVFGQWCSYDVDFEVAAQDCEQVCEVLYNRDLCDEKGDACHDKAASCIANCPDIMEKTGTIEFDAKYWDIFPYFYGLGSNKEPDDSDRDMYAYQLFLEDSWKVNVAVVKDAGIVNSEGIGNICRLSQFTSGENPEQRLYSAIRYMIGDQSDLVVVDKNKMIEAWYYDCNISYLKHTVYATWGVDLLCSDGGYWYREVGAQSCADMSKKPKWLEGELKKENGKCYEYIYFTAQLDPVLKANSDDAGLGTYFGTATGDVSFAQKVRRSTVNPNSPNTFIGAPTEDEDEDTSEYVWKIIKDPFKSKAIYHDMATGKDWKIKVNKKLIIDEDVSLTGTAIINKSLTKYGDSKYNIQITSDKPTRKITKHKDFVYALATDPHDGLDVQVRSAIYSNGGGSRNIEISGFSIEGFGENISGDGIFNIHDNKFKIKPTLDVFANNSAIYIAYGGARIFNNTFEYAKGIKPGKINFSDNTFGSLIYDNKFINVATSPIYIAKNSSVGAYKNSFTVSDVPFEMESLPNIQYKGVQTNDTSMTVDATDPYARLVFEFVGAPVGVDVVEFYKNGSVVFSACSYDSMTELAGIKCDYTLGLKDKNVFVYVPQSKVQINSDSYTAVFHGVLDWSLLSSGYSKFTINSSVTEYVDTKSAEEIAEAEEDYKDYYGYFDSGGTFIAGEFQTKYDADMNTWYGKVVEALTSEAEKTAVTIKTHCKDYVHKGVSENSDKMKICVIREGCAYLQYSFNGLYDSVCKSEGKFYLQDVIYAVELGTYGHPKSTIDLFWEKMNWPDAYYMCACKKVDGKIECEGSSEKINGKWFYDDLPSSVKTCMLSNECVQWDEGRRTTRPVIRRTYGQKGIIDMESECKIDGTAVLDYFKTDHNANMWGIVVAAYDAKGEEFYVESPAVGGTITPPEEGEDPPVIPGEGGEGGNPPGGSGAVVKEKCPDGSDKPENGDCTDPIIKCAGIWDEATSTCTPRPTCPYGDQPLSDGSCPSHAENKTECLNGLVFKDECIEGLISCPAGYEKDGIVCMESVSSSGATQSGCSMSRTTNPGVVLPYIMLLIFIHFLSFLFSPPSRGGERGG